MDVWVDRILKDGKLPFIVGGTNYYIESILWKVLIDKSTETDFSNDDTVLRKRKFSEYVKTNFSDNDVLSFASSKGGNFEENELKWNSEELHEALKEIDPIRANRLHPNDKRKIVRSIQVRFQTGKKHSDLINEQCNTTGSAEGIDIDTKELDRPTIANTSKMPLGGPLRYTNCVCLWIQAPEEILNNRIEKRVDEMVSRGLRQELDEFTDTLLKEGSELNFQEGLLQSIGFKEFNSYIQIPACDRLLEHSHELFKEGVDRLKTVTKQYARKQIKWIKHRFLRPDRRQVPPVYWLDGSLADTESWDKNVTTVAESILQAYLVNETDYSSPILQERRVLALESNQTDLISRTCEDCRRVFIGNIQWEEHLKSAKHRKTLKRTRKDQLASDVQDSTEVKL